MTIWTEIKKLGPWFLVVMLMAGLVYQGYDFNDRHLQRLESQMEEYNLQLERIVDLLAQQGYVLAPLPPAQ